MSDGMTDNRSQRDDADNWPFGRSERKSRAEGPTKAWCTKMAQAEGNQEIGAGFESASLAEPPSDGTSPNLIERVARIERDSDLLSQRLGPARPAADPIRLEALRIARDWRPVLPVIEVIEVATVIARFLDPASMPGRDDEPARSKPSISEGDTTETAVQPAGSDEGLMARLERHAKVIQRAFPRVSVSFSEALHVADAIMLSDREVAKTAAGDDPAIPAWQAAEVGDVVEIAGDANVVDGAYPVLALSAGGHAAQVLMERTGARFWVDAHLIKRIVRKAGAVTP